METEVQFNIRMIRACAAGEWKTDSLSTSQQVMVGLALCRPDLLATARYPDAASAWARLDGDQREAISSWWLK